LFQLAAAAKDGINSLSTSLGIEFAELRVEVQTEVADTYKVVLEKIGVQLQTVLALLFGLFGALSSEKSIPGDKLEAAAGSAFGTQDSGRSQPGFGFPRGPYPCYEPRHESRAPAALLFRGDGDDAGLLEEHAGSASL
jgi:hypothetical protein